MHCINYNILINRSIKDVSYFYYSFADKLPLNGINTDIIGNYGH